MKHKLVPAIALGAIVLGCAILPAAVLDVYKRQLIRQPSNLMARPTRIRKMLQTFLPPVTAMKTANAPFAAQLLLISRLLSLLGQTVHGRKAQRTVFPLLQMHLMNTSRRYR